MVAGQEELDGAPMCRCVRSGGPMCAVDRQPTRVTGSGFQVPSRAAVCGQYMRSAR